MEEIKGKKYMEESRIEFEVLVCCFFFIIWWIKSLLYKESFL